VPGSCHQRLVCYRSYFEKFLFNHWQKTTYNVIVEKERSESAIKSLKKDNSARTYLHILSRKFVGISTLHTSKSAANSRCQGLEFTAVPLTGIAL
jgi:hypothetical protein